MTPSKYDTVAHIMTPLRIALVFLASSLISSQVFAAAPTAVADVRETNANTSFTIRVLENDTDSDGDAIFVESISQPANGFASLNQDGSILYTPPEGFSGAPILDEFTYVLADNSEEGLTSTGTVSVTVRGGYEEFSNNENELNIATMIGNVCAELFALSDGELTAGARQLANQCFALEALATGEDANLVAEALNQIAPEEAATQTRLALDSNRTQVRAVSQRVQQQKTASLNGGTQSNRLAVNGVTINRQSHTDQDLHGGAGAGDESSIGTKFGLFANVQLEDAEREKTGFENGYEASSNSLTVGADYFVNSDLLVGTTFGYNASSLDYANNDGEMDSKISSLSLFTAYFVDSFSAYAQVGYGWLDFSSARHVSYGTGGLGVDERITSTTGGSQLSVNTRIDWEWHHKALSVMPFLRFDYLSGEVQGFEEQGSSGLEMALSDQTSSQSTIAAGLQSAYNLNTNWGVLVPTFSITYLSDSSSERDPIFARFVADPDPSRAYIMGNDGGDTAYYQASLGATALFPNGLSGFIDYSQTLGYQYLEAHQFQIGIRSDF